MCRQPLPQTGCSYRSSTVTVPALSLSNLFNNHKALSRNQVPPPARLFAVAGGGTCRKSMVEMKVKMKQHILFYVLISCGFLVFASVSLQAQSAVTVALSPNNPGAAIPQDFNGVSYETSALLGGNYFRSSNQPLLRMFSLLGIKDLRIGGETSGNGALPSQPGNTAGLGFSEAANPKLIFCIPFESVRSAGW